MRIEVKQGDVLDEPADLLICSANVRLNMSGGVNGAILLRGGELVQRELHGYLTANNRRWVEPGTVVRISPGPLRVGHILHAVAVDGMYDSSVGLATDTIVRALRMASDLEADTVSLPALATGYGRLSIPDFAEAVKEAAARTDWRIRKLIVVMRSIEDASLVSKIVQSTQ